MGAATSTTATGAGQLLTGTKATVVTDTVGVKTGQLAGMGAVAGVTTSTTAKGAGKVATVAAMGAATSTTATGAGRLLTGTKATEVTDTVGVTTGQLAGMGAVAGVTPVAALVSGAAVAIPAQSLGLKTGAKVLSFTHSAEAQLLKLPMAARPVGLKLVCADGVTVIEPVIIDTGGELGVTASQATVDKLAHTEAVGMSVTVLTVGDGSTVVAPPRDIVVTFGDEGATPSLVLGSAYAVTSAGGRAEETVVGIPLIKALAQADGGNGVLSLDFNTGIVTAGHVVLHPIAEAEQDRAGAVQHGFGDDAPIGATPGAVGTRGTSLLPGHSWGKDKRPADEQPRGLGQPPRQRRLQQGDKDRGEAIARQHLLLKEGAVGGRGVASSSTSFSPHLRAQQQHGDKENIVGEPVGFHPVAFVGELGYGEWPCPGGLSLSRR